VRAMGGIQRFMAWDGPMLTDSGGFQVFSLRDRCKIDEDGVTFRSHIDGSEQRLTPERAMQIQALLGSDIAMAFDHCPPSDAPRADIEDAMTRTTAWARRSIATTRPRARGSPRVRRGRRRLAIGELASEMATSTDIGLPLAPEGTAALLPAGVAAFGDGLSVDPGEVRLFLALREAAHHRLFGHVPWLRQHLLGAVEAYAAGITYFDAARSYGRAEEFLGAWLASRGHRDAVAGSKWGYRYTGDWRLDAARQKTARNRPDLLQ